jgi:hypothetical protein
MGLDSKAAVPAAPVLVSQSVPEEVPEVEPHSRTEEETVDSTTEGSGKQDDTGGFEDEPMGKDFRQEVKACSVNCARCAVELALNLSPLDRAKIPYRYREVPAFVNHNLLHHINGLARKAGLNMDVHEGIEILADDNNGERFFFRGKILF